MSRQIVTRRNILELLAFPRRLAKSDVDLSRCAHLGVFQALDRRCLDCGSSYECDWLNSTDQYHELAGKSLEFLYRALAFGIDYVVAHPERAKHDAELCDCDCCEWLREACSLAYEFAQAAPRSPKAQQQETRL